MEDCGLVHVARNRSMRWAVVNTAIKLVGNFLIRGKAVNLCRGMLLLGVSYTASHFQSICHDVWLQCRLRIKRNACRRWDRSSASQVSDVSKICRTSRTFVTRLHLITRQQFFFFGKTKCSLIKCLITINVTRNPLPGYLRIPRHFTLFHTLWQGVEEWGWQSAAHYADIIQCQTGGLTPLNNDPFKHLRTCVTCRFRKPLWPITSPSASQTCLHFELRCSKSAKRQTSPTFTQSDTKLHTSSNHTGHNYGKSNENVRLSKA